MCSRYRPTSKDRLKRYFGVDAEAASPEDAWPGHAAPLIRRSQDAGGGREVVAGAFGLVPRWAKDVKSGRATYNARSETVAAKPTFREAWQRGQHCIVPADAFYEPDWRSGRAVVTRIARADGRPMGIAGLWECWRAPDGAILTSFTMLTVNADAHPLMRHYQKPDDEKRMVVILPDDALDAWLAASPAESRKFITCYPAEALTADAPPTVMDSLF
jgi:putative SOS response-associated peptidase YedK